MGYMYRIPVRLSSSKVKPGMLDEAALCLVPSTHRNWLPLVIYMQMGTVYGDWPVCQHLAPKNDTDDIGNGCTHRLLHFQACGQPPICTPLRCCR